MRVVVVGLGIQGRKRRTIAGADVVATVDPVNRDADYCSLADIPLNGYDAALVCTPDEPKLELLTYLLDFFIISLRFLVRSLLARSGHRDHAAHPSASASVLHRNACCAT